MSKVTDAMQGFALGQALKYLEKNPEKIQAQYDLGYADAEKLVEHIKAYLND